MCLVGTKLVQYTLKIECREPPEKYTVRIIVDLLFTRIARTVALKANLIACGLRAEKQHILIHPSNRVVKAVMAVGTVSCWMVYAWAIHSICRATMG
jgi:hypothetical protein